MTCSSCVARVEKALLKVPGVESASINFATETATIGARGDVAQAAIAAVRRAGYEASREGSGAARGAGGRHPSRYAGTRGRGAAHGAARRAHAGRSLRRALDAARVAAMAARHAGAVRDRRPVLPRRLEGARGARRQHGPPRRDRDQRRLRAERVSRARRRRRAPLFRSLGRGDHAGARGQVARGTRQAPDHGSDPGAGGAAARDGAPSRERRRARRADRPGEDGRHGRHPPRRPGARRRGGDRRRRAMSTNRSSPARACRWPSRREAASSAAR